MKRNSRYIKIVILSSKIEFNDLFNKYLFYPRRLKIRLF